MSVEKEQRQLIWLESVDALDDTKVINRSVREALTALDSETSDVSKVGTLLSKEPTLAAKLLMIANSPFYGFHREVKDIQEAIVVLGGYQLKALLNSSLVMVKTADKHHQHFIQHSLVTAYFAQVICEQLGEHPETLFTAGLFHVLPVVLNYQHGIEHILSMPVLAQSSSSLLNKLQLPNDIIDGVAKLYTQDSHTRNSAILRMAFNLSILRMGKDNAPFKNILKIENDFNLLSLTPYKLANIYWDNQEATKELIDMVKN